MAFKKHSLEKTSPDSPEKLYPFRGASREAPDALWLHQGDVLRTWNKSHRTQRDVAIELPTGAGKTLVGGLIGEFQRQNGNQRVAYVCLTKQLARQVFEELKNYGLPVVHLDGAVNSWSSADRASYSSGKAIAISYYHHVFNSNPALSDAQYLILDDAHAADGMVVGPWRIEIDREDSLYIRLLSVLEEALDIDVADSLKRETGQGEFSKDVFLASPIGVGKVANLLEEIFEETVSKELAGSATDHAFRKLRGSLSKCNFYFSRKKILIRPFIPPTHLHRAFESPAQRLYLSVLCRRTSVTVLYQHIGDSSGVFSGDTSTHN